MKHSLLSLLFYCLVTMTIQQRLHAQQLISAKENVTIQEIRKHIEDLSKKNTPDAIAVLLLEAEALRKSGNEDYRILAADIYQKNLKKPDSSAKVKQEILARFPNGKTARNNASGKLLQQSQDNTISAEDFEIKYNAWLEQFPKKNFDSTQQDIYATALYMLADKNLVKKKFDRSALLSAQLQGSPWYGLQVCNFMYAYLKENNELDKYLPLLEDAYHSIEQEVLSKQTTVPVNVKFFYNLASLYAQVLTKLDRQREAIKIGNKIFDDTDYKDFYYYNGDKIIADTKLLAGNYLKTGNKTMALSVFENYLMAHPDDSSILSEMMPVFKDLYASTADLDTYLSRVNGKGKQEAYDKLKKKMILKKAPDFTLMDRAGRKVSLSDYKGKIVIIDFWSTWCVPCLEAFPGMQAALNKYAGNEDIEFLFINTWEREDNYKQKVEDLVTKNNYTFHILFDDDKDNAARSAAAYGINGVPTKIVIDKNGYIRFQDNSGGSNIEELIRDLDIKIKLTR